MKHLKQLMFSLVCCTAVPFIFASCDMEDASDVNQEKIYTEYEQFYNANTDKTTVIARFRFGGASGTILELKGDAYTEFNGEVLAYNIIHTGHAKEYAGQIAPGVFTFVDNDGNEYTNQIPATDSIAFLADFDTIAKSNAFNLEWLGNPLEADERVSVFIGTWAWGQDALHIESADGANSTVIDLNKLENLAEGNSTVFMDRSTRLELPDGTAEGGKVINTFRAQNRQVIITP